jgi:copper chaperone CopZ
MKTIHLEIDGMSCANCVQHVKEALEGSKGVLKAEVSQEGRSAVVTADDDAEVPLMIAAIKEEGYQAKEC